MTLTVTVSKRLPLLETGLGDAGSISTAQRNVYSAIALTFALPQQLTHALISHDAHATHAIHAMRCLEIG